MDQPASKSIAQASLSGTSRSAAIDLPTIVQPGITDQLGQLGRAALHRWPLLRECYAALQPLSLMILAFVGLRLLFFKGTKLPEARYFMPSITLAMGLHWSSLLTLAFAGWFVWQGWSKLRWSDLEHGSALRGFIGVVAGTLAWTFSVYDFNLYYNQGHYADRLLLIGLFCGTLWRPVLIAPFLALVFAITHQFDFPLPCTWTDKRVLFDVLTLFLGFLAARLWKPAHWPAIRSSDFVYLVLILQASNYLIPGWGKVLLGWPIVERLDNLFVASYLNGWWGFLSMEEALAWSHVIANWNSALVWGSLVVELGVLFCFWKRPICQLLLLACVGLHVGICITTGILFWKWIVLDLTLVVLMGVRPQLTSDLFVPHRRWLAAALMFASPFYFDPPWLAWYDTVLNEIYHLEVVTDAGDVQHLPRTFITPYEVYFAQNKFHFLSADKFVNGRYGTTANRDVAMELDGQPTPELAERVREAHGTIEQNAKKTAAFERFLTNYFQNLNAGRPRHVVPPAVHPPQHIYSLAPQPHFTGADRVSQVRVIHERQLFQRDRVTTLKREIIREISIPDATPNSIASPSGTLAAN